MVEIEDEEKQIETGLILIENTGISTVVPIDYLVDILYSDNLKSSSKHYSEFLKNKAKQMDEETAEYYAKIFWNLKKKGTPIPTNDIWVAASAMRHGVHLFTNDRHFESIDGLLLFV